MPKLPALLLVASVLSACAGSSSTAIEPGKTTMPQLLARLGQPTMMWSEGNGMLQLEFARAPKGGINYMARVASSGVLLSLQIVQPESELAHLEPGMSREQVRRQLGLPARIESLPEGEVWHWPLDQRRPATWQMDAHFGSNGLLSRIERSRVRPDAGRQSAHLAGKKGLPQL